VEEAELGDKTGAEGMGGHGVKDEFAAVGSLVPGSEFEQPQVPEQVDVLAAVGVGADFGVEPGAEAALGTEVGVVAAHIPEVESANAVADIAELPVVDLDNNADMDCNQDTAGSIADTVVVVDTIALQ
jgi:hypothetical protein